MMVSNDMFNINDEEMPEETDLLHQTVQLENEHLQERLKCFQKENDALKAHINTLMLQSSSMLEKELVSNKPPRKKVATEKNILRQAKLLYYNECSSKPAFIDEINNCLIKAGLISKQRKPLTKTLIRSISELMFEKLDPGIQDQYKVKASETFSIEKLNSKN